MNNKKPRPPKTQPIHKIMDKLADIMERCGYRDKPGKKHSSLNMYQDFIRVSKKGRDCTYSKKCQNIFTREDYPVIKDMILELIQLIRKMPGDEDYANK